VGAVVLTPEHNEVEPGDKGTVSDQGGEAHDYTRAFLDIEEHRWGLDEGAPRQCSGTESQGGLPAVGVSAGEARGALGYIAEHREVRAGTAGIDDAEEPSKQSGDARAFLTTTLLLHGSEGGPLEAGKIVNLSARKSGVGNAGGEGDTGQRNLEHEGVRASTTGIEDVVEPSEWSGGTRAFLATALQLRDGSEDESLKDDVTEGLDARGPGSEDTGGGGDAGQQDLEREEPRTAPTAAEDACGGRVRCTRERLGDEEQRAIKLTGDIFGEDLQEQWRDLTEGVIQDRRLRLEAVLGSITLLDAMCGNRRRTIMEEDNALMDELGDGMDAHCNWVGSNMDRAMAREGHARLALFNPRVMSQSKPGQQQQQHLWNRLTELGVNGVMLADDGLVDPTDGEPRSSLYRSKALGRSTWGQASMTWTRSQGQLGVVKEAVGGTSLVNDNYLSAIQAQAVTDTRCWGRYSGRILQGTGQRRLLVLSVYMPSKNLTSEGSAWCMQTKAMGSIAGDERQRDSWYQAVYDVIAVVKDFRLGSKSAGVREGSMVVIGGDFNQALEHKAGDDAATRDRTSTLQKLMVEADAGEAMGTLHYGVDVFTYEQSEERQI
jgi:hypothetical protein